MVRSILFSILFFSCTTILFPLHVHASHIVGGELTYECLGGNNYLITLKVYRDCFNGIIGYDNPTNIFVYDGLGNQIVGISPIAIPFPGSDTLPNNANNPCLIVPPNICVEQAIFQATVNLPPNATGYKMIYQRCCRNITTVNIIDPSNTGATYEATIPDSSVAICNSSPYFVNFPPTVICVDLPFTFDHSAIDPDGDSLVYGLCSPYDGAMIGDPYPAIPYPYNPVIFSSPYSAADPMGGAPPMSIDPQTGWLTVTPLSIGQFVVGVCVTEYRDGVMISLHRSDFQFNVTQCTLPPIASVPALLNGCDNSVFTFPNYSSGATSFFWDFGVPGINSDTSVLANPTYTYPDTGVYTVTVYANPGDLCGDTATILVYVYPGFTGNIVAPDGCEGIPVQFSDVSTSTYGIIDSWNWNFANLGFSALQNPIWTFNTTGVYSITLIVGNNLGCVDTVSSSITINPQPLAFASPDSTICNLDTIQLFGSGIGNYLWLPNYGLSNNSIQNPLASPDVTTQYILTVTNSWGCFDKDTITITVIEPVTALPAVLNGCDAFTFTFPNYSTGATAFFWDFGVPGINSDTSVQFSPTYTYTDTGVYTVTLYANPGTLCGDTATVQVFVYPTLTGNIIAPDGCEGLPVQFFDFSTSTYGSIDSWNWNFANLGFSSLQNPAWTFNTAGVYLITLIVGNTMGCVDTVSASITINPPPLALASPDSTICYLDTIQLFGNGIGTYLWLPNYGLSNNSIQNPLASPDVTTQYILTVTNAWGCFDKDTITITVMGPVAALPAVLNGCDDFLLTFPNYSTGATSFFWDFGVPGINSDTSVLFSPAYSYADTGVYTVTLYANSGTFCGDTATVQVYVYPTFTGNIIAPDGCEGIPVQFLDSSTTTYGNINSWSWNFANLGFSSLQNVHWTFNTAGVYSITLIVGNSMGCVDTVSTSITIHPKPLAFAGPDTTICSLDTIQLFGNGNGNYLWLPNYSLSDDSAQNPLASPDITTQYFLQVTDAWGCFDEDTIVITVIDSVNLIVSNDTVICPLGQAQLNASGGFNYFWYPPDGLSNQNIPNPVATPVTSTSYTVYANIGSCFDSAIVYVTVKPFPNIASGPDQTICIGDSVMIEVCCGFNYLWDPANTLTDPYIATPIAFPSSTTEYHVAADDTGNCSITIIDSVTVFVIIPEPLITSPDTLIFPGSSVQLYAIGGENYVWTPSTALSNQYIFNPVASPVETIKYFVYATTAEGCKLSDSVLIEVELDAVVFFPNAFTPNQDGTNDYFYPIVLGYFETDIFEIFNRWGQLRYKSNDIEPGWDGRFHGKNQEVGTYVYFLKGRFLNSGKPFSAKGNLELLR